MARENFRDLPLGIRRVTSGRWSGCETLTTGQAAAGRKHAIAASPALVTACRYLRLSFGCGARAAGGLARSAYAVGPAGDIITSVTELSVSVAVEDGAGGP